jgi:hypothetical protein
VTGALWAVLFEINSFRLEAIALWAFWVFVLYAAMVALRMLGLIYHTHAHELLWFHDRPKWGDPARIGKIYTNS